MTIDEDYDAEAVVLVPPRARPRPPRALRPTGSRPGRTPRPVAVPEPIDAETPEWIGQDHDELIAGSSPLGPKKPLLVRLLRLQHVRPTGWQRAAVGDFPILVAVLLVLSDLATAWTLLVLPVVVLALVKFHDVIESRLAPLPTSPPVRRPYGETDPH